LTPIEQDGRGVRCLFRACRRAPGPGRGLTVAPQSGPMASRRPWAPTTHPPPPTHPQGVRERHGGMRGGGGGERRVKGRRAGTGGTRRSGSALPPPSKRTKRRGAAVHATLGLRRFDRDVCPGVGDSVRVPSPSTAEARFEDLPLLKTQDGNGNKQLSEFFRSPPQKKKVGTGCWNAKTDRDKGGGG